jgi:hypothetical protein
MNHELICSWLKIPPTSWPPDHYTLLGLRPGEQDAARIERHAQWRMDWLRRYQLAHPDLVTEAMNRLAQAFDTLRDPQSKKAYDDQLQGKGEKAKTGPPPVALLPAELAGPTGPAGVSPPAIAGASTATSPAIGSDTVQTRFDKNTIESLSLATVNSPALPAPGTSAPAAGDAAAVIPLPSPPVPVPEDPALEAARSAPARRGLGTKRAIYQRISRTRGLIRAWVKVGTYLGNPGYKLTQKNEAIDLVRQLTIIRHHLQDFPPLLGEAGQPGYLVVALARQPEIVKTFQGLSPVHRKAYVGDWKAGLTFLAAYRFFLREELQKLRTQGRAARLLRFLGSLFTDYPGWWLLVLGGVAANLAFPVLQRWWPAEVVGALILMIGFILYRNLNRRRSFHRSRRRRE